MAKHDVGLLVAHDIPIGNKDVELVVKVDAKPLGRIRISRGSVDWIPSPNQKAGYRLSWSSFAALMQDNGKAFK